MLRGPAHSRGFPATSGHLFLLGDGSVSLAGSLQGQSTGQRRTVNECLPSGEATLAWGSQRGPRRGMRRVLRSGIPGSEVVPKTQTQGCRLPEESEAGEGRTCISLALHPLPQPSGYRLGRLYSGYVTPERGSRVSKGGGEAGERKREERRGAAVGGVGSTASSWALWVSFRRIPGELALPQPVPQPPPQFPLTLLSVPPVQAGGSDFG